MKKNFFLAMLTLMLSALCVLALAEDTTAALPDGVYQATFNTDSSMFRLHESCEGKGILTVQDGIMTIHITLLSKSYQYAYPGPLEEAQAEGAVLIEPTQDDVICSDGFEETVHGFDIPVPALDQDYVISLIGKKGKWYNHTVSVTDPVLLNE